MARGYGLDLSTTDMLIVGGLAYILLRQSPAIAGETISSVGNATLGVVERAGSSAWNTVVSAPYAWGEGVGSNIREGVGSIAGAIGSFFAGTPKAQTPMIQPLSFVENYVPIDTKKFLDSVIFN